MASTGDESGFGWTDPAFLAEAHAWIRDHCVLTGPIEQPHIRPWATALRVPAVDGTLWFKASIPALAHEVPLLVVLNEQRLDSVPRVFASDSGRGWMLLEDAGVQLFELEGYDASVEHWTGAMAAYGRLQVDAVSSVEDMLRAGVPDARWPALFDELEQLVADERNLRASPDDAVTAEEAARLRRAMPRLREHAARLDELGLPYAIQHDDVHVWNVFVHDRRYVFLDWGDSCISHPLLSIGVPFEHSRDAIHTRIRDAYLEPWTPFAPMHELVDACNSAVVLAKVTAILKWARIYNGLQDSARAAYDEVITDRTADLLTACA